MLLDLINTTLLLIYVVGVVLLYGSLYGYIANNSIYPYKKAPLFWSVTLSIFVAPALIVLYQITKSNYEVADFKFIPTFKLKRSKVQYYDADQLHNIWYCGQGTKFGPGIAVIICQKMNKLWKM